MNFYDVLLAAKNGGAPSLTSWYDIRTLVRQGKAPKYINIGDQFECKRGNDTIVWDNIGFNQDVPAESGYTNVITFCTHQTFNDLPFEPKQALFVFEDGLEAGTYYFTVGAQPWVAGDVNKIITFTLETAIPASGQLVINNAYNATMIGATISSYASPSATLATETVAMSEAGESPTGINLGTINNAINSNINSIQRALLGSNNWENSVIRQWLNSEKAAGAWWSARTMWDRVPSWASTKAGFLNGMDSDFLSCIKPVKKKTALNTVTDGGGYVETIDRVFLLSRTEVYGGNENNIAEGQPYSYFKDFSTLTAPGPGEDANRIKYENASAKRWWLRSPNSPYANYARLVTPSGSLSNSFAYSTYGVVPACCIY